MLVGENDAFCQPLDVVGLIQALPGEQTKYFSVSDYNHMDYIWASDASSKSLPIITEFLSNV